MWERPLQIPSQALDSVVCRHILWGAAGMPHLSSCTSRPHSEHFLSGLLEVWGERGELPGRWVTTYDGFFLLARVLSCNICRQVGSSFLQGVCLHVFTCLPVEQQMWSKLVEAWCDSLTYWSWTCWTWLVPNLFLLHESGTVGSPDTLFPRSAPGNSC